MSVVNLHVEDLLDKEVSGVLTVDERQTLEQHTRRCDTCRFERQVRNDFAEALEPMPGEVFDLESLIGSALSANDVAPGNPANDASDDVSNAAAAESARRSDFVARRLRQRALRWLAPAAIVLGAGAAAAYVANGFWGTHDDATGSEDAAVLGGAGAIDPNARTSGSSVGAADTQTDVSEPALVADPQSADDVDQPETREPTAPTTDAKPRQTAKAASKSGRPHTKASPAPEVSQPVEPTSGELFSKANQARRAGETDAAAKLYRELQKSYPQSPEARLSHAILARLMLDKGNKEDALREYQDISKGDGAPAEFLFGRARALQGLGKFEQEQQVLRKLLSEHPDSVYAQRARVRLSELEKRQPPPSAAHPPSPE